MPKVTVVAMPAEMLSSQPPISKKNRSLRKLPIREMLQKGYAVFLSLVWGENALFSMLAFLLGRLLVMGEFAPAGLAFFAAVVQVDRKKAPIVGFWAMSGVFSSGYYYELAIYASTIGLYYLWADKLSHVRKNIVIMPIFAFICVLCIGFLVSLCKESTLYNTLLVLFEAGICMLMSYIFTYCIPLLKNSKVLFLEQNLRSERLSCVVILLAMAVAGIGNIGIAEYSIRNIIGSILIMVVALTGGAGQSGVMGVVIGLVVGISDGNATLAVSLYALAGVFAGVFRGFKKLAVIVGFFLGSAITTLYFGQDGQLGKMLIECIIAGGMFLLLPSSSLAMCQAATCRQEEVSQAFNPQTQEVVDKINSIAEVFKDLGKEFGKITTDTMVKIHDDQLAKTLTAVGEQICFDCTKRSHCWEADFYRTYNGILEMVGQVKTNTLEKHNIPKVFRENCIRRQDLLNTINLVAERNHTLGLWQKKLIDNKQMITEQMKAVSSIVGSLAYEIGKEDCSEHQLASNFREKALKLGCQLTTVRVTDPLKKGVVEISKPPCNGNRECANTLLPMISGLMKEKMTLHAECGNKRAEQKCKLTMETVKRFHIEIRIASCAKDEQEVCGDSHAVMELNKGRIALVLSDGMGIGSQAQHQSKTAIDFLQKLLVAGFDTDVAVKTVNSMLLLRSPEESFVTIDIGIIDTYSGEIEFLKIGSAPSFIKRVGEVATVTSTSLPVGILEQIEIQPIKAFAVAGDFIVMVSDGIIDVPQSKLDKGNWLANFLRQTGNGDPQVLASRILMQAKKMSGDQVLDDMTVVIGKIVESGH